MCCLAQIIRFCLVEVRVLLVQEVSIHCLLAAAHEERVCMASLLEKHLSLGEEVVGCSLIITFYVLRVHSHVLITFIIFADNEFGRLTKN